MCLWGVGHDLGYALYTLMIHWFQLTEREQSLKVKIRNEYAFSFRCVGVISSRG